MPSRSKKPRIKAIIFDLGGVVMHGGFLDMVRQYCKNCLTPAGKKQLKQLERDVNLGNITETEFYRQMRKVFGVQATAKQMHDHIIKKMQKDKELLKMIPTLKKAKIALFTNSIGHIAEEILRYRKVPTNSLFVKVFDSVQIHMAKPDAVAYKYALKKLKVKPGEALMVDDREVNVRGAQRIGMKGIVYKSAKQFKKELSKYELG